MLPRPNPAPHRLLALAVGAGALLFAPAAQAKITKGPWIQRVTETSAQIRVETDGASPVRVDRVPGPDETVEKRTYVPRVVGGVQIVDLTELKPAVRYAFVVHSGEESRPASFTTAPTPDAKSFRFLIYGDSRTDAAAHAAVVRGMLGVPSDFLLYTGDFVEDGASARDWQSFFEVEAPLLRERCVFSCVGNHELVDGQGLLYARYFGPTDPPSGHDAEVPAHLNGTFRWGNTRFFLLNGMVGFQTGADRAWLERAVADSDTEPGLVWRIAVVHFGPYSSGPHGENPFLHEADIPGLLRQHRFDLIVSGHDHIYERGMVDHLAYLVSGGGGAPTYRVKTRRPYAEFVESVRHFVDVTIDGDAIRTTTFRVDGTTAEKCVLKKKAPWDCGGPKPATSAPPATSRPPDPPASSGSKCGCREVGARDTAGAWPIVLVGLSAALRRHARRSRTSRGEGA